MHVHASITRVLASSRAFVSRYERHISALLLVVGAFSDALFLPNVEKVSTYFILGTYILAVMLLIFINALIANRQYSGTWKEQVLMFSALPIPLFIGSLLSAIFIYYSRGSSLLESAPFIIFLFVVLILTEIARDTLKKLELRIALLYFILYMGMTFGVPVFVGMMSPLIFLISGFIALLIMSLYILVLSIVARKEVQKGMRTLVISIVGISLFMNVLYFSHNIPPIPLALRVAEVAHSVTRLPEGNYALLGDSQKKAFGLFSGPVMHTTNGTLSFFSAVYAPTAFHSQIVHVWEYRNEQTGKWVTHRRIIFPITGGRENGYRGYSTIAVVEGKWRVRIETSRGELLGIEYFSVVEGVPPTPPTTRLY